jgi:hypothetical protein
VPASAVTRTAHEVEQPVVDVEEHLLFVRCQRHVVVLSEHHVKYCGHRGVGVAAGPGQVQVPQVRPVRGFRVPAEEVPAVGAGAVDGAEELPPAVQPGVAGVGGGFETAGHRDKLAGRREMSTAASQFASPALVVGRADE